MPGHPTPVTDAAALAALEAQEARLRAVAARLAEEIGALPRMLPATEEWWGPARLAYDGSHAALASLLRGAAATVDDALLETARALATLRGRP